MTYELAKQLKEAGYPQVDRGSNIMMHVEGKKFDLLDSSTFEWLTIPTLEELIEACRKPEHFVSVGEATHEPLVWEAKIECWEGYQEAGDETLDFKEGSTPTEAVAKLWLALNKKKEV